jgi:hypothetical protein
LENEPTGEVFLGRFRENEANRTSSENNMYPFELEWLGWGDREDRKLVRLGRGYSDADATERGTAGMAEMLVVRKVIGAV